MEIYCVSYKKYTAKEHSSVRKSKQNRLMLYYFVPFVARENQVL